MEHFKNYQKLSKKYQENTQKIQKTISNNKRQYTHFKIALMFNQYELIFYSLFKTIQKKYKTKTSLVKVLL